MCASLLVRGSGPGQWESIADGVPVHQLLVHRAVGQSGQHMPAMQGSLHKPRPPHGTRPPVPAASVLLMVTSSQEHGLEEIAVAHRDQVVDNSTEDLTSFTSADRQFSVFVGA